MRLLVATNPTELRGIADAVHDAYFDDAELQHDPASAELRLPFAQETWWPDLPHKELVRRTWRFDEFRVPFLQSTLCIRETVDVEVPELWGAAGMLLGISFDAARHEVRLHAGLDPLVVRVAQLDVTTCVTDEVSFYMRRRVGRLLRIASDQRV